MTVERNVTAWNAPPRPGWLCSAQDRIQRLGLSMCLQGLGQLTELYELQTSLANFVIGG